MRETSQETPPERVVEIGQWFNPFLNSEDIPTYEDKDTITKIRNIIIHPLGKFDISLMWIRGRPLGTKFFLVGQKGLVILPLGEEKIDIENFRKTEEKLESKLLILATRFLEDVDEKLNQSKAFPYAKELRSPSQKTFVARFFTSGKTLFSGCDRWQEVGTETEVWLLIPEVENILEKIQMRIVPANQT